MANRNNITKSIRWIARISGSIILAFVLFFLFAHLFGEDKSGNGFRDISEVIAFVFFPVSTVIGLSLAYKWEGLGGIITIIGIIGLFILRPDLIASLMTILFIPGVLYTVYWFLSKNK